MQSSLSKNKLKEFTAFKQSKYRKAAQVFTVEGAKLVDELLNSDYEILTICAEREWIGQNIKKLGSALEVFAVLEKELERLTNFSTPSSVWALVKIPSKQVLPNPSTSLVLALDHIKDPGNLGTIIRIADWFGITDVLCSFETVNIYNPKCLQATMGSVFRVNIHYVDLNSFFSELDSNVKIYGTLLEGGENIYEQSLSQVGIILIGNESTGISEELQKYIMHKLFIPCFERQSTQSIDSLNAAISTAIVCSEFRRRERNID